MIPCVYDCEGEGIRLEFDFENGTSFNAYLTDDCAKQLISLMQNKINARWKK